MLLLLSQDAEEVGRVVALLDQMAYFAEQLDMDTDHTPGQEEGTLVCSVGKSVYADCECSVGVFVLSCNVSGVHVSSHCSQPPWLLVRRSSSLATLWALWFSWEQMVRHTPTPPPTVMTPPTPFPPRDYCCLLGSTLLSMGLPLTGGDSPL